MMSDKGGDWEVDEADFSAAAAGHRVWQLSSQEVGVACEKH